MSSKRNQTIAIARFLMYKHGLNQQLEGMTDEEYLAHPIGLDVGQYVADLMKYCPEHRACPKTPKEKTMKVRTTQ